MHLGKEHSRRAADRRTGEGEGRETGVCMPVSFNQAVQSRVILFDK